MAMAGKERLMVSEMPKTETTDDGDTATSSGGSMAGELELQRALIIGAAGPTGWHLARELAGRGVAVRAAGRSRERLAEAYAGVDVELVSVDALAEDQVERAANGCDLVVDCVGLPADRMADHPRTARSIARALQATGALGLQVSSFWAYLPVRELPISEEHPRRGGVDYVRWRREAEDILGEAGAAVVNLPDFYGPRVHTSTVQQALVDAIEGRAMSWVGGRDTPREVVYVPDAMATVADLAGRSEAYGERWVVGGAGPLTGADVEEMVCQHLGRKVRLRAAGPVMLRVVSLFVSDLRLFMPMVPEYVRPIRYDDGKLRALLGEPRLTSYRQGIGETLDWLRGRTAG
jgi:nucleoside-diphosphate-sugar epimerase